MMLSKTFDSVRQLSTTLISQHAVSFIFCMQVSGVDYCGRFVNTAMQIQNDSVVKFGAGKEAKLPEGVNPKNINFVQVRCHSKSVTLHKTKLYS